MLTKYVISHVDVFGASFNQKNVISDVNILGKNIWEMFPEKDTYLMEWK